MTENNLITIDGPAASGKTSVSRELANRLGFSWVSTGAFYRGLAFAALQTRTDISSENAVAQLCDSEIWHISMSLEKTNVFFDSENVTELIASEDVGLIASRISQMPKVRQMLLAGQRACHGIALKTKKGLIAEGRDCGTVVFPEAPYKIYLTARSEDRASRRAKELGVSTESTLEQQVLRDQQDTQRKTAPLAIPDKALVIDTSTLSFEEVVLKSYQFVTKPK